MTEEEYWYWFCNVPKLSQDKLKKLLKRYEKPQELFQRLQRGNIDLTGLNPEERNFLKESLSVRELSKVSEGLECCARKGIRFIHRDHIEYPERFLFVTDKPNSLYVKGKLPSENEKTLAVVGARACTAYGRMSASGLSKVLAEKNVSVVSGMARGIDTFAHTGALEAGGRTYAVLGCGVDVCYPRENIELYSNIVKSGGVISEYPLGTPPLGWQFPHRNRIISALSDAVLVVEARQKSGSLITMEFALEQGKDIYAVPGRMGDSLSEGCNRLIKNGAALISSSTDLLEELGLEGIEVDKEDTIKKISKEFQKLYKKLDSEPKYIGDIIENTKLSLGEIHTILIQLQMLGLVKEPIKNHFCIND